MSMTKANEEISNLNFKQETANLLHENQVAKLKKYFNCPLNCHLMERIEKRYCIKIVDIYSIYLFKHCAG